MSAFPKEWLGLPVLSVRQPWAWLIVHGGKDVENRTWPTKFRGRFLVHAACHAPRGAYAAAREMARRLASGTFVFPAWEALQRGGIVGEAELADCVPSSDSPWFEGPFGFVLKDAKPLPFHPCKGRLGFWRLAP